MASKMEDLNLPQSAILKIIKEAIGANINIGKDVKAAVAKAASLFILYITSQSTQYAQSAKRKTITSQDIFDSLREIEFGHFIEPLKKSLQEHNEMKGKKNDQMKKDNDTEEADAEEEEDVEEPAENDS